jgi:osmotically inducible lipoprotein OsmB
MSEMGVRRLGVVVALAAMVGLAGCEVNRTTGERTLTGAGVGAASGAAVGLLTGDFLGSTLTGAAAGAAGGFVYDQIKKNQ